METRIQPLRDVNRQMMVDNQVYSHISWPTSCWLATVGFITALFVVQSTDHQQKTLGNTEQSIYYWSIDIPSDCLSIGNENTVPLCGNYIEVHTSTTFINELTSDSYMKLGSHQQVYLVHIHFKTNLPLKYLSSVFILHVQSLLTTISHNFIIFVVVLHCFRPYCC